MPFFRGKGRPILYIYTPCIGPNSGIQFPQKIILGKYSFKETTPAPGYKINRNTFHFVVASDGSVSGDSELADEPTKVVIKKTDSRTGDPLGGAQFTVFDKAGQVAASGVSDESGNCTIYRLEPGDYRVQETVPPAGYQRNTDTFRFTITEDGKAENLTVPDEPTEVTITTTSWKVYID